jgi:hypothetical protein
MVDYSAGTITSWVWAQPNLDPVYTETTQGDLYSTGLGDPHFAITIEWDWPEGDWTHYNIIRTVRSPARVFEEGQPMIWANTEHSVLCLKSKHPTTTIEGRPYYVDPQPPPGEWVYYTLFFLSPDRIWIPGGSVLDIGPADHDWTLRLPEFLPGASVTVEQGVAHPADQDTTLTQFLQGPGTYLDTAVTMAEAVQYFWSPTQCPPANFEALAKSWGYGYSDSLGLGRSRAVIDALRRPSQGSLLAIKRIAEGATGCETAAIMSDNWMLDTNDSSFESGPPISDTAWGPTASLAGLELWDYPAHSKPPDYPKPIAPPNISYNYHLYIPTGRTLWCGFPPDDKDNVDPIRYGIPVAGWTHVRMGCYAYDRVTTPVEIRSDLTMGMDFYDINGYFIQTTTVLPTRQLSTFLWEWHGNGDAKSPQRSKAIMIPPRDDAPSDALTNTAKWTGSTLAGYAQPQNVAPVAVAGGMQLSWAANPTTAGDRAFQGITGFAYPLTEYWKYLITIKVKAVAPQLNVAPAAWRPAVAGRAYGDTVYPVYQAAGTETEATSSFEWLCRKGEIPNPQIGIEVLIPAAGWTKAGKHTVTSYTVIRQPVRPVYGVPWLTVTQATCVDLIVVDSDIAMDSDYGENIYGEGKYGGEPNYGG